MRNIYSLRVTSWVMCVFAGVWGLLATVSLSYLAPCCKAGEATKSFFHLSLQPPRQALVHVKRDDFLLYVILNELIVKFWGKHVKVTNLYHFFNYYSVLEKSKRLCRIRPLGEAAMDTKGFCLKTADVFTTNKLLESGKHLTEEALIWFDFTERFLFFFHSQFFFWTFTKSGTDNLPTKLLVNFLNLFYYGKSKSDGNVLHRNFEVIISSTIFSTDTLECKEKMHVFSWRWSWCGIALNLE